MAADKELWHFSGDFSAEALRTLAPAARGTGFLVLACGGDGTLRLLLEASLCDPERFPDFADWASGLWSAEKGAAFPRVVAARRDAHFLRSLAGWARSQGKLPESLYVDIRPDGAAVRDDEASGELARLLGARGLRYEQPGPGGFERAAGLFWERLKKEEGAGELFQTRLELFPGQRRSSSREGGRRRWITRLEAAELLMAASGFPWSAALGEHRNERLFNAAAGCGLLLPGLGRADLEAAWVFTAAAKSFLRRDAPRLCAPAALYLLAELYRQSDRRELAAAMRSEGAVPAALAGRARLWLRALAQHGLLGRPRDFCRPAFWLAARALMDVGGLCAGRG
ncbi:hypothetical protein MUN46_006570 [Mesosutterella sp. AGMB02718]|uniref:DUF4123 domain-containing protein n=1 Tax=Mesosutterella faecium TaxID=2925194 RepID=A0ABT7IMI6_9BURK|nr:hypothetical protein [Mesosutterella sp. AGMB02718]MDL2059591.1 hypothetical protein [Mesosutterella sp. AGMB02718]